MDSRESSIQDLSLLEQREMVLRALKRQGHKGAARSRLNSSKGRLAGLIKKYRGVAMMFFGQLCLFLMMFLVKVVDERERVGSGQIQTIRAVAMLMCQLVVMKVNNVEMNIHRELYPVLFLRAFTLVVTLSLAYYTVITIGLHQVLTLLYVSPCFTAILAAVFLRERLRVIDLISVIASFIGAFLLIGSCLYQTNHIPSATFLLPLLAALFSSFSFYLFRRTQNQVDSASSVVFFSTIAVIVSAIIALFQGWISLSNHSLYLCFASGALGWVGQVALTKANQNERLSLSSSIGFLQIFLSFVVDATYFGDSIGSFEIFGAFLIIVGVFVISTAPAPKETSDLENPILPNRDYQRLIQVCDGFKSDFQSLRRQSFVCFCFFPPLFSFFV